MISKCQKVFYSPKYEVALSLVMRFCFPLFLQRRIFFKTDNTNGSFVPGIQDNTSCFSVVVEFLSSMKLSFFFLCFSFFPLSNIYWIVIVCSYMMIMQISQGPCVPLEKIVSTPMTFTQWFQPWLPITLIQGVLKICQCLGCTIRVSDLIDLCWGLITSIFKTLLN